jgi:hypothetical protein
MMDSELARLSTNGAQEEGRCWSFLFVFMYGTMEKNKFGSLDVELMDLDEINKLKKEDVMAMLKQAEHLQWKGPEES